MKREMTEAEAYRDYQRYCDMHKPTKHDPLRTFSGWIEKYKVKIVDLTEDEARP